MKRSQIFVAFSLKAISLVTLLAAVLSISLVALIPETVEHARKIDESFSVSSAWIGNFKKLHERLPTVQEFTAWSGSQPDILFGVKDVRFISSPSDVPDEVIRLFGHPIQGSYLLEIWRGEWAEYFASWANASSVDSAGGLYKDVLASSLILFAVAAGFWVFYLKFSPRRAE